MYKWKMSRNSGFTILELLIVIAIIGILSAVVLVALGESKEKGRDGKRKSQTTEIIKALELYYSDGVGYPNPGGPYPVNVEAIVPALSGGGYLNRAPEDLNGPQTYQYCVNATQNTFLLAINTEEDRGGSDFCSIIRGPDPSFDAGCAAFFASDSCSARF